MFNNIYLLLIDKYIGGIMNIRFRLMVLFSILGLNGNQKKFYETYLHSPINFIFSVK